MGGYGDGDGCIGADINGCGDDGGDGDLQRGALGLRRQGVVGRDQRVGDIAARVLRGGDGVDEAGAVYRQPGVQRRRGEEDGLDDADDDQIVAGAPDIGVRVGDVFDLDDDGVIGTGVLAVGHYRRRADNADDAVCKDRVGRAGINIAEVDCAVVQNAHGVTVAFAAAAGGG